MNHDALQRAIDSLVITDVYPRSLSVSIDESYEPTLAPKELAVQWKYATSKITLLQLDENEKSEEPRKHLRVAITTGVRFLLADSSSEAQTETSKPIAQIEAIFCAEYRVTKELDHECAKEFAQHNVMYHVWPYWREMVQHETARFRLPLLVLPMFRLKRSTPAQDVEDAE